MECTYEAELEKRENTVSFLKKHIFLAILIKNNLHTCKVKFVLVQLSIYLI